MKIDFDSAEEKRVPGFKGGTGTAVLRSYEDDTIKLIRGYLEKGSSIGMHTHEGTSETVYILEGTGKMIYDGTEEELKAGSCSYCPEGHTHSLVNTGEAPLQFLGVIPKLK
ncbi:MAG: cupin domain-containing protein [Flexilinea sp.]|nr:cupin domain-containing protein [Flexilinea sp.]